MSNDCIKIRGARVNNLKNIDIDIPQGKLVVITGVSGSGKSSLAFDTLYAEGQRRYVESLSTYARQFMGRMGKPDCDFIENIPPAIAIEQKVVSRNPRSTVGTSTEIYDYLRMLFARVGRTYSPISGQEVKKHSVEDVVQCMKSKAEGTKFMVMCPLVCRAGRTPEQQIEAYARQGLDLTTTIGNDTYIIIARMRVRDDKNTISQLTDACETAIYEGEGRCTLQFLDDQSLHTFSLSFEADGMTFEEPNEYMFSFNSPVGACPECEGFGKVMGIDESLVIPNQELNVYEGAVFCWRGEKMSAWKEEFCRQASKYDFPIFEPYFNLTPQQRDLLWHGTIGERKVLDVSIDRFFDMLRENQYKIQYRVMLARYRGKAICPTCHGTRLRREATYVKIGGKSITELVEMPVGELADFFDKLELNEHDAYIASRLLIEIKSRLHFLIEVGLSYLTLSRLSNTLSGGESQRINLATSLGSSLVGSLYILDEPSIGLHSRDTQQLIAVLCQLRDLGNTVVVVEHDEEIIRAADYIIDIGPDAGRLGGQVVWQGSMSTIKQLNSKKRTDTSENSETSERSNSTENSENSENSERSNNTETSENSEISERSEPLKTTDSTKPSHTIDFLTHREVIAVPSSRRPWNNYILIRTARENNLKGIDVKIPLNVMTVVTGVSGSGKSTLVRDIFYRAMMRQMDRVCDRPGQFMALEGDVDMIQSIEFVDQNPIGTSTRSNPVTYIGAYDEIRRLMASQQLAKQMGYTPQYFSFNTDGGRCDECKGEGTVTVEMQFMNDLVLTCESCHGRRFKSDILEVKFHEKNIDDILNLTVNMAIEFFGKYGKDKIVEKLKPLQDVGLGYIKLGQTSSTLSGGENQRVKLAYYLGQEKTRPTMFIFDEPTTGLHFHDIKKLLTAFQSLITRGHSILIIEHNMEVIKSADHIIDLGPEGGAEGGYIVAEGTPEQVAKCKKSYTGQALKPYLKSKK